MTRIFIGITGPDGTIRKAWGLVPEALEARLLKSGEFLVRVADGWPCVIEHETPATTTIPLKKDRNS